MGEFLSSFGEWRFVAWILCTLGVCVVLLWQRREYLNAQVTQITAQVLKEHGDNSFKKATDIADEATMRAKEGSFFANMKYSIFALGSIVIITYIAFFAFRLPVSSSPAEWGQVGDFFGGMLNPILAFASFIALLYTIRIQSEELRLTRKEFQKSVEAQREMATSHESSVNIQSETARMNRAIAEFEHLSLMLQAHMRACSFLLYEYSKQAIRGQGANQAVVEQNHGLWQLYFDVLETLGTKNQLPITLARFRRLFEEDVKRQSVVANIHTLRREALLIGKFIGQLEENEYFKSNAEVFTLEFQRVFIIVYIYFGETEFSNYSFDPKPYFSEKEITLA